MARIRLQDSNAQLSSQMKLLAATLIEASDRSNRIKRVMDTISNGGANPELLEVVGGEAAFPKDSGQVLYAMVQSIQGQLTPLLSQLAQIDQG